MTDGYSLKPPRRYGFFGAPSWEQPWQPSRRPELRLPPVLLQRRLPLDHRQYAQMRLIPDKPLQPVFLGETRGQPIAVLIDPGGKLAGHADVDRVVTAAGHNVDGDEAVEGVSGDHAKPGVHGWPGQTRP